MTDSEYEKFQQRIFDQLDDLELAYRERVVADFVERGAWVGIDVIAEILDKGKPASEVLKAIGEREKSQNSK